MTKSIRARALLEATGDAKVILENKHKADIYGVDVKMIPTLERKIDDYVVPQIKSTKNKISALLIKRIKRQREKEKNPSLFLRSPANITAQSHG